ncbi:MAG: nitroreductase family protein [Lachnospiraceae bacterium]|nr:nitroreductase family protein [Lachnospiraceae bacterium]
MEFTELIKRRRSVRAYEDTLISHEDLVKILTQAQQAPSWKNQQTSRCYVAETRETADALREAVLPEFNRKSSAGAALIVTTFVPDVVGFNGGLPANEAGNYWGAYDLGLHDAYLVLAASDAGYDTLIMGIRDADAIREQLQIPENEQIMSVIAVGKRAKEPADRPRKELGEVVRFQ